MLCAPSPRRGSALVALFSWTLPGVIGSSVSSANKVGSIVFSLSCARIAFFSCLTRLLGFAAQRWKAGGRGRCAWSPTLRESFPVLPAARAACSRGSMDVLPQVAEFTPSLILLRLVRRRAARFCGTPALSLLIGARAPLRPAGVVGCARCAPGLSPSGSWRVSSRVTGFPVRSYFVGAFASACVQEDPRL